MNRIAHIENGVVINVSVASTEWLEENRSETVFECPDHVGYGFLYDSKTKEFSPPPAVLEFEENRKQAIAKLKKLGLTVDEIATIVP